MPTKSTKCPPNNTAEELDKDKLNLTLLAPPNSVWETVLANYKLDPVDLYSNSTLAAAQWAFHIAQGTVFVSGGATLHRCRAEGW